MPVFVVAHRRAQPAACAVADLLTGSAANFAGGVLMKCTVRGAALAWLVVVVGCSGRSPDAGPVLPDARFDVDAAGAIGRDAGPALPRPDAASDFVPCGPETCGDGLDGNCDGRIDDGCFCVPGDTSACFRGPAESRGVGACHDGTMACMDALEFGTWRSLARQEGCGTEQAVRLMVAFVAAAAQST